MRGKTNAVKLSVVCILLVISTLPSASNPAFALSQTTSSDPQSQTAQNALSTNAVSQFFASSEVFTSNTNDSRHPIIHSDNEGNIYALWDEGDNHFSGGSPGYGNVYGNFWNASEASYLGDPAGWNGKVLLSTGFNYGAYEPAFTIDNNGLVHLVFQAYPNVLGDVYVNVFYRTWDVTTNEVSSATQLTANTGITSSRFADIAVNSDGDILVTYESNNNNFGGNDLDVLYRFRPQGYGWNAEALISEGSSYMSSSPSIASDSQDVFHVVWSDNITSVEEAPFVGVDFDIFYRNFTGSLWSGLHRISISSDDASTNPAITVDDDNNVHVAWADKSYGASNSEILYRSYYNETQVWKPEEVVSNAGTNTTGLPDLVIDNHDNVHLSWTEKDGSDIPTIVHRFKDYYSQQWSHKSTVSFESTNTAYHPSITNVENKILVTWDDMSDIKSKGGDFDIMLSFSDFNTSGPSWVQQPLDQAIVEGDQLVYVLSASDEVGLDYWSVNDTVLFQIDQSGVLRNNSNLVEGIYGVQILVNNTYGFSTSAEILVDVTAPDPQVPSSPRNVDTVLLSAGVNVTWDKPQYSIGSDISGYKVFRSVNNTSYEFLASSIPTHYLDTNIVKGTMYSYQVLAINGEGEGVLSVETSITPLTVPNPPMTLSADFDGTQIDLQWIAPIDNGGTPIIEYTLYRSVSNSSAFQPVAETTQITYSDSDVETDRLYFYKVTATNAVGESGDSNVISVTTDGMGNTTTDQTPTDPSDTNSTDTSPLDELPTDPTTIIIIVVAAAGVVTTIIIIIRRRRG